MKFLALFAKKTCGPGMLVHHGFGTTVTAEEIGANFTIRQLATVGYGNNSIDCPKIGSNVIIGVGARVLGGVTIGDDVVVGANSACDLRCPCGCDSYGCSSEDSVSKTHCRSNAKSSAPASGNGVNHPVAVACGDAIKRRPALMSSYEPHGGHGRPHVPDTPKAQRPWRGRGQFPAVGPTDLPPLFVPLLVLAHRLPVSMV